MPVLLLAHGDPQAKDLLKRAIEARYGLRPPALDSLKVDFKGRARAKVGPVTAWVPVEATAYFRFPDAMRWDFTIKPLGVPVQRGVEAYDGTMVHVMRGGKPTDIRDTEEIASMRRRLWAIASTLLTPLGDQCVKLTMNGENSFNATNTLLQDTASIYLRPDKTLDYVQVMGLNPDNEHGRFIMRVSAEQEAINDLILPKKISAFWNDAPYFEMEPVNVESNPHIVDFVFKLEKLAV